MSDLKCELLKYMLEKYYGQIVTEIGLYIYKYGPSTFQSIANFFKELLKIRELKFYLSYMVHHDIISFEAKNMKVFYDINLKRIENFAHLFKYLEKIECHYGKLAKYIVIFITKCGKMVLKALIKDVYKLSKTNYNEIENTFNSLISGKCIKRAPWILSNVIDNIVPNLTFDEKFAYNLSHEFDFKKEIQYIEELEEGKTKKFKSETSKIYWVCNYDTCTNLLFTEKYLEPYLKLFNTPESVQSTLEKFISRLSHSLKADYHDKVSHLSISFKNVTIKRDSEDEKETILNFVNYLCNESKMLQEYNYSVASSSHGWIQYDKTLANGFNFRINVATKDIYEDFIFGFLYNKYGPKTARIYNLIKKTYPCEQKRIEERAMMAPKEAKENLYVLMEAGLITMQEISKSNDFAPSRTFFLFRIATPYDTVQLLSKFCYGAYINLIEREKAEQQKGKHLFEKRDRVEAIIANLPGPEANQAYKEQIEEIRASIIPADLKTIQEITDSINRLRSSMFMIDDFFILFTKYLLYS